MKFQFQSYNYTLVKKRFHVKSEPELSEEKEYPTLKFSAEGQKLFIKAICAAMKSSKDLSGKGKVLPLQGVIDLAEQTIHLGALTPRDSEALSFNETPLFEHKQPGLFDRNQYSPRLRSYQTRYSEGPTAHQQLLHHAVKKPQVSANDAENKRGFAFNIQVIDENITITIDGNSLSINETAQYLRTTHQPNHELSAHEAKNEVLKASGIYSPECEDEIFNCIAQTCKELIFEHGDDLQYSGVSPSFSMS